MLKYYTDAKCEYLLYFTRRFSIVTAVRFVIVDFKEMNEWMLIVYLTTCLPKFIEIDVSVDVCKNFNDLNVRCVD